MMITASAIGKPIQLDPDVAGCVADEFTIVFSKISTNDPAPRLKLQKDD
jgi:hypothetical protein